MTEDRTVAGGFESFFASIWGIFRYTVDGQNLDIFDDSGMSINILLCCLISCLFASINLPTHEGFGIAIFPYLIYLMLFKKEIKLKNYFLIIFFGLNSDIVRVVLAIPFIPLILFDEFIFTSHF